MIHHPAILVPKLVVLGIIVVVLIILHGILSPAAFVVAVIVSVIIFVLFTIGLWVFAARMLSDPNSRLSKASVLSSDAKSSDGFTAHPAHYSALVGKQGKATSSLHPAGIAIIDGKQLPVQSGGQFIDAGSTIEVVEVIGAKVVVKVADPQ